MWESDGPRLPAWIKDTYEILVPYLSTQEDGASRDDVATFLTEHGELELSKPDVNYALEQLLNRGYLYEVDSELYVTDPDR